MVMAAGAEVTFSACVPKFRELGEMPNPAMDWPVPDSGTVLRPPAPLWLMFNVAERAPAPRGAKVSDSLADAPGVTVSGSETEASTKSPGLVPDRLRLEMTKFEV